MKIKGVQKNSEWEEKEERDWNTEAYPSNIQDGAFWEYSYQLKAADYFDKTSRVRYLTGFWINP